MRLQQAHRGFRATRRWKTVLQLQHDCAVPPMPISHAAYPRKSKLGCGIWPCAKASLSPRSSSECSQVCSRSRCLPKCVSPPLVAGNRAARLYVRIAGGDRRLLRERGHARGLAAATYAAVLLRMHLHGGAPLPRPSTWRSARPCSSAVLSGGI
jgi:hypothetical protein